MISDPTVKRIGYTHDDTGRVTKITSYTHPAGTTVLNEIARTYSGASWDRVTAVEQAHNGATTGSGPKVQYAYEDWRRLRDSARECKDGLLVILGGSTTTAAQ